MTPQKNTIFCGGNLEVVASWPSNCISAVLTDPPYGLGFMGKDWDTFKQENVNLPKTTKLTYKTDYKNGVPVRRKNPEMVTRDSGARRAGSYDLSRNPEFQQWFTVWAKAMLRITKPGGFLLCFGGTRTYHRLACAIEDAGWEIRDCMMWLYGSGFPKSHNISKAIDKAAGAKRKSLGISSNNRDRTKHNYNSVGNVGSHAEITVPATSLAEVWEGYGTALKPAWEPIIVAMKPLDGTFAHNAERHGVAGLNIDGGRIGTEKRFNQKAGNPTDKDTAAFRAIPNPHNYQGSECQGRWPANLILDEEAGAILDEQSGDRKGWTGQFHNEFNPYGGNALQKSKTTRKGKHEGYKDSGGASRFFYCAKTSRKERNMGMENCEDKLLARSGGAQGAESRGEKEYLQKSIGLNRVAVVKNNHPTVKPLALMKYLCTLLKMPSADQIILDPFLGSGTTGMACKELGIDFIGIEKEPEYCEIAVKRIAAVSGQEITLDSTLPVTKNVETFRTTKDFAGGSRRPNENLPHISEDRQRLINAASAALREKRK